ncbi:MULTISPECIES: type II toxin-antitoxin system RelE/ParE family toxin [Chryseobacterium]|uniref:Type II toxin-antitoxin system RelE/ParE family toxin n=1 Tax=Candidatus Chryseobacterium massiliense TaxID=204089 RepID=A0A3D9BCE7_9FLAO|nr:MULTISPECIES: type II toxin-antitoxin system RelE/ParE family toxin [Chryseobacterium]REC51058.1 type II toxin-antitoxin system RelE/ParE family toxin [Candidatus Chryseobacterium massiliae]
MKIIWTEFAIEDLKIIFDYYASKANKNIAHKIRKQIFKSTKQLIQNPQSGQLELHLEKLNQQHRYILSGNYKIIYKLNHEYIIINDVFDARQNPTTMINEKRNIK